MVVEADRSGPRSGFLPESIGVGTVTMMNRASARTEGSELYRIGLERSVSGGTSPVLSLPASSSATRSGCMSTPMTWKRLANAVASGNPTYPSPMTQMEVL